MHGFTIFQRTIIWRHILVAVTEIGFDSSTKSSQRALMKSLGNKSPAQKTFHSAQLCDVDENNTAIRLRLCPCVASHAPHKGATPSQPCGQCSSHRFRYTSCSGSSSSSSSSSGGNNVDCQ